MIRDHLATTPRTKRQLAELTGWTQRDVELAIQQARLEGLPVCSNGSGYWLGSASEVAECAQRLRQRAIHQLLTARAMRRTARRMTGVEQRELWSDEAAGSGVMSGNWSSPTSDVDGRLATPA